MVLSVHWIKEDSICNVLTSRELPFPRALRYAGSRGGVGWEGDKRLTLGTVASQEGKGTAAVTLETDTTWQVLKHELGLHAVPLVSKAFSGNLPTAR